MQHTTKHCIAALTLHSHIIVTCKNVRQKRLGGDLKQHENLPLQTASFTAILNGLSESLIDLPDLPLTC